MSKIYRQNTFRLRVQRGPRRPDLVSERPTRKDKQGNRIYLDSEEKPTLVTFDEYCQVDIPGLLRIGAIVEYKPPKPKAEKEVRARGQSSAQPG